MNRWVYNGLHFIYDAGSYPVQKEDKSSSLNDSSFGVKIVNKIVDSIDMTLIVPPITVEFPHNKCELRRILNKLESEGQRDSLTASQIRYALQERQEQTYGWSTIAMVAESHIAIHTFPDQGFVTADVYSCKYFDFSIVENIFDQFLFPSVRSEDLEKKIHVIERKLDLSRFK